MYAVFNVKLLVPLSGIFRLGRPDSALQVFSSACGTAIQFRESPASLAFVKLSSIGTLMFPKRSRGDSLAARELAKDDVKAALIGPKAPAEAEPTPPFDNGDAYPR